MKNKRFKITKGKPATTPNESKHVRLNKLIASLGNYTRKEADKLIEEKKVEVNGVVVSGLGIKVDPQSKVLIEGKEIQPANVLFVVLNKQKNTAYSAEDEKVTIDDLLNKKYDTTLTALDPLGVENSGVQFFTNDTAFIEKLKNTKKIKQVFLLTFKTELDQAALASIKKIADIEITEAHYYNDEKNRVGIEINDGNHAKLIDGIAALGLTIKQADRVYFAGLTKKDLQRNHSRTLKKTELAKLKMGNFS